MTSNGNASNRAVHIILPETNVTCAQRKNTTYIIQAWLALTTEERLSQRAGTHENIHWLISKPMDNHYATLQL